MNFKKQAAKLETYLDDEFKQKLPIAVLPDASLVYKNYRVKQHKNKSWILYSPHGNIIDNFNLKACALLAAKFYSLHSLSKYNEIKHLDTDYQNNLVDSVMFKHRYDHSTDAVKKDTCLWRWEITTDRAKYAKSQIVTKFNLLF